MNAHVTAFGFELSLFDLFEAEIALWLTSVELDDNANTPRFAARRDPKGFTVLSHKAGRDLWIVEIEIEVSDPEPSVQNGNASVRILNQGHGVTATLKPFWAETRFL